MVPKRFCIGDKSADMQHAYLEHHMTSWDLDLAPPYTHSYMEFMESHKQLNNKHAKIRSIIPQSDSPIKITWYLRPWPTSAGSSAPPVASGSAGAA